MRMVRNDRNMQRVLTRLTKFVVVDGLRLSVLNKMYHNGMIYTKMFLRPLCWTLWFVNVLLYQTLYILPNLLPHIISGSGAPTSLIHKSAILLWLTKEIKTYGSHRHSAYTTFHDNLYGISEIEAGYTQPRLDNKPFSGIRFFSFRKESKIKTKEK